MRLPIRPVLLRRLDQLRGPESGCPRSTRCYMAICRIGRRLSSSSEHHDIVLALLAISNATRFAFTSAVRYGDGGLGGQHLHEVGVAPQGAAGEAVIGVLLGEVPHDHSLVPAPRQGGS